MTMPRAVLGLLGAGAVALFAMTREWASATVRTSGLPTDHVAVTGVSAAPLLAGLAVVIVAGALAVVAAGGWFRQLIGLVIAAVAGFAALRALTMDAGVAPLRQVIRQSPAFVAGVEPPVATSPWPLIASAACAVACGLGLLVALRGRRWPRMAARYDRVPDVPDDASAESDLWRAQDQGRDPTR